ncbi:hypothetical protein M9H77_16057 [Catharanthus roseus]|uniref:Uncharacterized protein n=1 Tax=Catharanthus roseus TaxID=4058 RepID=A0ACC0AZ85_CATRO|nr:hypothetical protein M9H77_16057 [Catharanthus roseus]
MLFGWYLTTRCRNLVLMASFWGSELCPWSPTVALHILLNLGVEAALMCLDSLRLPSCARNPHIGSSISFVKIISSGRSGIQQTTEVLGQEFLDQISPEGHITERYADALLCHS